MASLWADGWFYISAGGFLVSCVLFVFLLGQYRAAVESEDEELAPEGPAAAAPAQKIYVPKPVIEAPKPGVAVSKPLVDVVLPIPVTPKAEPAPAPAVKSAAPAPAEAPPPSKSATLSEISAAAPPSNLPVKKNDSTGGMSPAVVYLQNLKGQMEHLEKDIGSLKSLASQHAAQNDSILKRLSELTTKLENLSVAAAGPAPVASTAPEPAPAAAPAPQETALPQTLELSPLSAPPVMEAPPAPSLEPKVEPLKALEIEIAAAAAPKPDAAPNPVPASDAKAAPSDADKTMIIEQTVAPIKLTDAKSIPLPTRPGYDAAPPPAPAAEADPPSKETDKPADPAAESPKPARKGPVWPI